MPQLYQINVQNALYGQGSLNRYYYFTYAGGYVPDVLSDLFVDFVSRQVVNIQSEDCTHTTHRIFDPININNIDHVHQYLNFKGQRTKNALPSFSGWYYGLHTPSRAIRNGRKTYMGVQKDDQLDNEATAAMEPILEGLDPFLGYILGDGTFQFIPVLARIDVINDTFDIFSYTSGIYSTVSTQSSRKARSGGGVPTLPFADSVSDFSDTQILPAGFFLTPSDFVLGGGELANGRVDSNDIYTPFI